jgi:hypothetical protein
MTNLIDTPKIVTALIVTTIIGVASWYVSTQVMDNRLKNVENQSRETKDLYAAVSTLVIEIAHTNKNVLQNTKDTRLAAIAHNKLREESIVGYVGLKSIATIQTSLVKSVASLNNSVIELRTIMQIRNNMVSVTSTQKDTPHPN